MKNLFTFLVVSILWWIVWWFFFQYFTQNYKIKRDWIVLWSTSCLNQNQKFTTQSLNKEALKEISSEKLQILSNQFEVEWTTVTDKISGKVRKCESVNCNASCRVSELNWTLWCGCRSEGWNSSTVSPWSCTRRAVESNRVDNTDWLSQENYKQWEDATNLWFNKLLKLTIWDKNVYKLINNDPVTWKTKAVCVQCMSTSCDGSCEETITSTNNGENFSCKCSQWWVGWSCREEVIPCPGDSKIEKSEVIQ